MFRINFLVVVFLLSYITISHVSHAQETCPNSISVNETVGTPESVLNVTINCSGAEVDGYVGVQIEIENIKQAVYYITFARNGSISESSNYLS
jgi:hypothetical protein